MLPQHGHEHEDRGNEDEGEGDLGDGPRGEGLDVVLGAAFVDFFVPAGEGGEEDEADKGEDDGDDAVPKASVRLQQVKRGTGATHIK